METFIIRNQDVKRNCLLAIQALPHGKVYEVRITEPKRSCPQNALYWKHLQIIADFLGEDKDELHEILAFKFLPVKERDVEGGTVQIRTRTSKLNKKDFSEYMNKVEALALELGLTLPQPSYYGYE